MRQHCHSRAMPTPAPNRRKTLLRLSASALAWPWVASAQGPQPAYPREPLRLLAAFHSDNLALAAGGFAATFLAERLRTPVKLDTTWGNNVATLVQLLRGSPKTGHNLLVADTAIMSLQGLALAEPGYQPDLDLIPVARLGHAPLVLAVRADIPAGNLSEFTAWAQGAGSGAALGSPGAVHQAHWAALQLRQKLWPGAQIRPAAGGAAAVAQLLAGETQALVAGYATLAPLQSAKKVRLIATFAPPSSPSTAGNSGPIRLPSLAESDADMAFTHHVGLFMAAYNPVAAVNRIAQEVAIGNTLAAPRAALSAVGLEAAALDAASFFNLIRLEAERMARLAKALGVRAS